MTATAPRPMEKPAEEHEYAEVWSPRMVGGLSLVFGYLAGVTLAAINWWRLGETSRAVTHVVAVALLGFLATLAGLAYGGIIGVIAQGLMWIGTATYLYTTMGTAIERARFAGIEVEEDGWATALAVAIVMGLLMATLIISYSVMYAGPRFFA